MANPPSERRPSADNDYPQPESEMRRDDLLKRLRHTPPKPSPQREHGTDE
ncbi:MAG: hypothetical protein OHK0024_08340 [Thalassobaculales bacterium]